MKTVYYLLLGLCLATAACKPDEPEVPALPTDEIINGTCGENLAWSYNKTKAILTISGTGEMKNYDYNYGDNIDAPWKPYRTEIQTVVIEDGVTSIGDCAFYNCSALTQVTIPEGVTSIGRDAFERCSALAEMTVLATVPPTITTSTFRNINPQVKVSIPEGSRDVYMADDNWKWLLDLSAGELSGTCGDNLTWRFTTADCTLTISGTGNMYDYYSGGQPWYNFNQGIKNISISNGVTSIGNYAFSGCSALAEMNVLPTVPPTITKNTFYNINPQVKVSVPEGSRDAYMADENWKQLLNLSAGQLSGTCGDNLTWTFTTADGTLTISGRGDMYNSDDQPWYNFNQSIKNISMPDGMTSIGNQAFVECSALTQVTIPSSVTSIGNNAFLQCSALAQVNIPNNVTSIGNQAFAWCSALTQVALPESVTNIGNGAFSGCKALTAIRVDAANTTYSSENGVLFNKNKTTLVQYPAGKQETAYTIPNSVTSIGYQAFSYCYALTEITIPASATSIGAHTFYYCYALTEISVLATVPPTVGYNAFFLVNLDIPVYVPAESLEAYKAADGWKEFTNLQAIQ